MHQVMSGCCVDATYECMGRKIEVQETVRKGFNFFQAILRPVKVAPIARVMLAIP